MKYKSLSLLIIVLFSACTIGAQNRKKVGIVLSGGGAKGVAHIGALKVIEEAGIPIDYVVGTSMGAIVGGLYSIGYTPQQLDSIVNAQDWKYLLSDALDPETTLLSEKLRCRNYKRKKYLPATLRTDSGISRLHFFQPDAYSIRLCIG